MRPIHRSTLVAVALGTVLVASKAHATLAITTDFPAGTPLAVAAGGTSSAMTASVFDPEPASGPNDNLLAYQVRLTIVPQGGATGTLSFATPATGPGPEPPNYVLPDNVGLSVTNSGSGLFFFDVFLSPSTTGVDVPDSPGQNLLAMTYSASADAQGLFSVMAVPGATNTVWTDNTLATREFTNMAGAMSPVAIGEVLVGLPGDYNRNGTVDAADYVVWRDTVGLPGPGQPADGNNDGLVNDDDYNFWRAHFGQTAGSGSSAGGAVPEPATWLLILMAAAGGIVRRCYFLRAA